MTCPYQGRGLVDHHEARVLHIGFDGVDEMTFRTPDRRFHRHPRGPSEPREHPEDEARLFAAVAKE